MAKALRRTLIAAGAVLAPAGVIIGLNLSADAAVGFPAHYAAPYLQISTADVGDMFADKNQTGLKYYTLAFLTPKSGSGCTPIWENGNNALNTYTSQVKQLQSAGGNVIISFGGAEGGELAIPCTNVTSLTAAYRNVLNTYPGVKRLDFDIEGGTLGNKTANARRNQVLAALQKADPSIEVDFTVQVEPTGMPGDVLAMLKDAVAKGVKISVVNLMTMDYYDPQHRSNLTNSISAANGAHGQLSQLFPGLSSAQLWNKLGFTIIAGKNDDGTPFSQTDAATFENFAAGKGAQELSFWEVHDYDRPTGYKYSAIFNKITSGGPTTPPPSTPGTPPTTTKPPTSHLEAEKATLSKAVVAANHPGYTGTGFVDYAAASGSYIEWTVSSGTTSVKLTFRYANGSQGNRPTAIIVNGTTVTTLNFAVTGSWSTWKTASVTVTLKTGTTSTIRATATTLVGGPNVDWLELA
jgi:chitinase